MNSQVEEVKNRINIADLIGEYIRLQKAGSNWRALCPFHNEKTPSFMVNEEKGIWHCFGCGKGGDAFTFVMEIDGMDFRNALETLAKKAGVELKKFSPQEKKNENDKNRLFSILDLATKWYEKNLWEGKGKGKILDYLRKRGLDNGVMKKFRLGYAPDGWRNILEFLLRKGYKVEEIAKTGLLVEKNSKSEALNPKQIQNSNFYDRFRDRIMFPIQDITGRVVGFSARVAPGGDEKNAKYINTPQGEIYDKGRVLYGLNLARTEIKKKEEAIVVEGNMDVISAHQAGNENTIAVSGTALTSEQIRIIKRYTENIKMSFDMDEAGQEATRRSAKLCLENDLNVKIILLPEGKDASDIIKKDKEAWDKSVKNARNIVDFYFEDTFKKNDSKDPTGKKKIAKDLLNVIKDIASPVEQNHWIKILSEKLGTNERVLIDVIKKATDKEKKEIGGRKPENRSEDQANHALERRLIGLILNFPKESRKIIGKLNKEYFIGEKEKAIVGLIIKKEDGCSLEKIQKDLDDRDMEKIINEAVFKIEVEFGEEQSFGFLDPLAEMEQAWNRLKAVGSKNKIAKIVEDIKIAEERADKKAVEGLIDELRNITSQLEI